jgi:hypothetical protein
MNKLQIPQERVVLALENYLSGFSEVKEHKTLKSTTIGALKVLSYLIFPISLSCAITYSVLKKEKQEEGLDLIAKVWTRQIDKEA